MVPKLTKAMIETAIRKAAARVCVPGDHRCYAFPSDTESAHQSCTPKGRCKVAGTRRVIVSRGERENWDVWLEARSGLVKLIAQTNA